VSAKNDRKRPETTKRINFGFWFSRDFFSQLIRDANARYNMNAYNSHLNKATNEIQKPDHLEQKKRQETLLADNIPCTILLVYE